MIYVVIECDECAHECTWPTRRQCEREFRDDGGIVARDGRALCGDCRVPENASMGEVALGTMMSVPQLAERFDIGEDDVEDLLLDEGVETCGGCGWWVESSEIVDEDGEIVGCESCRR